MANILTPVGFLCFPHLFTPKANQQNPGQGARYSCILLFDDLAMQSAAYTQLRQGVMDAITGKWGAAKAQDQAFLRSLRLPFRPSSEKNYGGFDKGKVFISPWSKGDQAAPGVIDLQGSPIVVPGDVFAGQLARGSVNPFAYDNNGNRGVAFGLNHVQIVKPDMPRMDNRVSADNAFKDADNSQLAALGINPGAAPSAPSPSDLGGAPGGLPGFL